MLRRSAYLVALISLMSSCSDDPPTSPAGMAGASGTAPLGGYGGIGSPTGGAGSGAAGKAGSGALAGTSGSTSGGAAGSSASAGAGSDAGGTTAAGGSGGSGPEPAEVVVASGQKAPTGIALDSESVYWCNRDAGSIVKCPLTGCDGKEPTVLASNVGTPLGLALDDKNFYWMSPPTDSSSKIAQVLHCPLSGCTGVPEKVVEFTVERAAVGVHVVDGTLYYAAWPQLATCPISGCEEATELQRMPALALDSNDTSLFVGRVVGLLSCTLDTCTDPVNLAQGVMTLGVAVDATHVYFTTHDYFKNDSTIVPALARCPLAGCGDDGPEQLKTGDIAPFEVAVNEKRVFYTDVEAGTVFSLEKTK